MEKRGEGEATISLRHRWREAIRICGTCGNGGGSPARSGRGLSHARLSRSKPTPSPAKFMTGCRSFLMRRIMTWLDPGLENPAGLLEQFPSERMSVRPVGDCG